jgi:hypothetical protein
MTSKCEGARSSRETCQTSVKIEIAEDGGAVSGTCLGVAIFGIVAMLIYRTDDHVDSMQTISGGSYSASKALQYIWRLSTLIDRAGQAKRAKSRRRRTELLYKRISGAHSLDHTCARHTLTNTGTSLLAIVVVTNKMPNPASHQCSC